MTLLLLACTGGTRVDAGGGSDPALDSGEADSGIAGDTAPALDSASPEPDPLPLCINEVMADNTSVYKDSAGRYPDWIELHNPGTEPVDLAGWTLTDDRAGPEPHTLPEGVEVAAGGFLLLAAVGSDEANDATELPFSLASAGGEVALLAPDGRGTIVSWGACESDFALARATDCCTEAGCLQWQYRGTPGDTNTPTLAVWEVVFPLGSTWAYKDDGVEIDGWESDDYDDTAWSQGPAPLGYGDDGMATTLSYGADAASKPITTWYRLAFTVTDAAAVVGATLGVRRDDAAVVYLNGEEAFRSNMPEGSVTGGTLATTSTSGVNETAVWEYPIDSSLFREGTNLIAVEVHQHSPDSSDLVLDAVLEVAR